MLQYRVLGREEIHRAAGVSEPVGRLAGGGVAGQMKIKLEQHIADMMQLLLEDKVSMLAGVVVYQRLANIK